MFVGSHPHSLDDKGRLVLPAPFRPELKQGGVIAPWDRCVALWAPEQFDEVARAMKAKVSEGDDDMDVVGLFFAAAHNVKADAQGRFVIPEEHRRHAGLERDTMIIGRHDRIEIWDRDRFSAVRDAKAPRLADVIHDMRF